MTIIVQVIKGKIDKTAICNFFNYLLTLAIYKWKFFHILKIILHFLKSLFCT